MIAYIEGEVKERGKDFVVILTKTGLGYLVFVPFRIIGKRKLSLFVFHYRTEKTEALYGFSTVEERELFRELLKVAGLGPKGALALLSLYKPSEILEIIEKKDVEKMRAVPGIGLKLARKIITDFGGFVDSGFKEETELKEALKSLGFSSREIVEGLGYLDGSEKTLEEKIFKVLKSKGKNG